MERISHNELPEGFLGVLKHVQAYIDRSGLDKQLVELMCMRVSQLNSCARCLDMHYKYALLVGETPLRLISVSAWRETPYYSAKERAVLAFAEMLTKMPDDTGSEHIHDELREHFTTQEIAYLTLAVAQINTWNRVVRSFGSTPGNYVAGSRRAE